MVGSKKLILFLESLSRKVEDVQPAIDDIRQFIEALLLRSTKMKKCASLAFMVSSVLFNILQAFGLL